MKTEQRKRLKEKLASLSTDEKNEYSKIICEKLETILTDGLILSYSAIKDEVDVKNINDKYKVLLPTINEDDNTMEAYMPNGNYIVNNYGILEPNPHKCKKVKPENIKYIIVPCLGFNDSCYRLGKGKGYYDRYLLRCKNAIKIGVAYQIQKLDDLAIEQHDFQLDLIVTNSNIYQK